MADTKAAFSLVLIWQISLYFWFLSRIFSGALDLRGVAVFLFYEGMFLFVFAWFILRAMDRNQSRRAANLPVQELLSFDLTKQFIPFAAVGLGTGVALTILYRAAGTALVVPAYQSILEQVVEIVPSETLIFCYFLPQEIRDYLGVPSFIWAAVYAGIFHYFAYSADVLEMGIAVLLFSVWSLMIKLGPRPNPANPSRQKGYVFLGIGAAIAMHFVINLFAISVKPSAEAASVSTMLGPFLLPVALFMSPVASVVSWATLRGRTPWSF